ncbi:MAG: hypothetical protein WCF98_07315 [Synechococcus sp. ELA057]
MTNLVLICDEQAELIVGGHRRHRQNSGPLLSLNFPELKSNDGGIYITFIIGNNNANSAPVS